MILFSTLMALLLDRLLGEPKRYHPLVGFGLLANKVEKILNKTHSFWQGVLAWSLVIIPITLLTYWLDQQIGGVWLSIITGWLAIGWQSLRQHGIAVLQALQNNQLDEARLKTSYIVSRNTSDLDEVDLSRATIESLLENGGDAIFSALFWLLLFGAPGVVFYRLCNTLDAMWGYRNARFEQFGKFSAIIDDALNYIPARLTALLYVICGDHKQAWQAWQTQSKLWYSPNAGVVMSAGAGALGLKLGGSATYHGKIKDRPILGLGQPPTPNDIQRALKLINHSVYLCALVCAFALLLMIIKDTPPVFGVFVQ